MPPAWEHGRVPGRDLAEIAFPPTETLRNTMIIAGSCGPPDPILNESRRAVDLPWRLRAMSPFFRVWGSLIPEHSELKRLAGSRPVLLLMLKDLTILDAGLRPKLVPPAEAFSRRNEMTPKEPMRGPGYFQWNTWGWFGSQLGSTCWMLVGGAPLAYHAPLIGVTFLVCFAVANAIGTSLWLRRERLRPYPAMQIMLLVIAISGIAALASFDVLRPADVRLDLTSENGGDLHEAYLIFLVGVPLGMVWFYLMERSVTAARARAQGAC
jgi:hypothetical protein